MNEQELSKIEAEKILEQARLTAKDLATKTQQETTQSLIEALRQVFGEHEESKRFIDITKIPLICQSIVSMDKRIEKIDDNLKWIVRLIIGSVILAVLGLILVK